MTFPDWYSLVLSTLRTSPSSFGPGCGLYDFAEIWYMGAMCPWVVELLNCRLVHYGPVTKAENDWLDGGLKWQCIATCHLYYSIVSFFHLNL